MKWKGKHCSTSSMLVMLVTVMWMTGASFATDQTTVFSLRVWSSFSSRAGAGVYFSFFKWTFRGLRLLNNHMFNACFYCKMPRHLREQLLLKTTAVEHATIRVHWKCVFGPTEDCVWTHKHNFHSPLALLAQFSSLWLCPFSLNEMGFHFARLYCTSTEHSNISSHAWKYTALPKVTTLTISHNSIPKDYV